MAGPARVAALGLLLASRALAECKPADPKAVAAAEKELSDAEYKAEQAEAIAVKSGNPGAHSRARQAQEQAAAARRRLAELTCKAAGDSPGKLPIPSK